MWAYILYYFGTIICVKTNTTGEQFNLRIAVLLPMYGDVPVTMEKTQGILAVAFRDANILLSPLGKLHYSYADTGSDGQQLNVQYDKCTEQFTAYHAINFYYNISSSKQRVAAFLGASCMPEFYALTFLATRWNIPVITPLGPDQNNRAVWPTVIRTGWTSKDLVTALTKTLLSHFNWQSYFLIYDEPKDKFTLSIGEQILMYSEIQPLSYTVVKNVEKSNNYIFRLLSGSLVSRVFILDVDYPTKRNILLDAFDLGLLKNGEYVFIDVELWNCQCKRGSFFNKLIDEPRKEDLHRAFESVLIFTVEKSTMEQKQFHLDIKNISRLLNYSYIYEDDEEIGPIAMGLYDGLLLYANTIKQQFLNGENLYNGREITEKMIKSPYETKNRRVSLKEEGDGDYNYVIWDFHQNTKEWRAKFIISNEGVVRHGEYQAIHWPNQNRTPLNIPECGYGVEMAKCLPHRIIMSTSETITVVLSILVIFIIIVGLLFYRKYKYESELSDRWWEAKLEDIIIYKPKVASQIKLQAQADKDEDLNLNDPKPFLELHGEYKGIQVTVHELMVDKHLQVTRQMLVELKMIRDLQHINVCRFVSISIKSPQLYILIEFCAKGSLKQILQNKSFKMDEDIKMSFIQDIVSGMAYLHSSPIKYHGNLRCTECYVDSRLSLKISGFGLNYIRMHELEKEPHDYEYYKRRLYIAPELLRLSWNPQGTPKGDIYSFSIIAYEILTLNNPFNVTLDEGPARTSCVLHPKIVLEKIKGSHDKPFRPSIDNSTDISNEMSELLNLCWNEHPNERPDFVQIKSLLKKMNKGVEENVVDNLLRRMELYANNLEKLVEERTGAYLKQKKEAENLLYEILPKKIADRLKMGEPADPEAYESVTLYFSDIVGFSALSSEIGPNDIVTFLNDVYTCFDNIITYFDVYKVETIADSYMVVSGAPITNGITHAREIARLALALRESSKNIKIRHRPEEMVKLRIGIHSGPIAAGVIGLKMPRYCMFGDTVNTSSRMESNGEAFKIHISPQTKAILDNFQTFETECRGEIQIKGKGSITTYWLLGERSYNGSFIKYSQSFLENSYIKPKKKMLLIALDGCSDEDEYCASEIFKMMRPFAKTQPQKKSYEKFNKVLPGLRDTNLQLINPTDVIWHEPPKFLNFNRKPKNISEAVANYSNQLCHGLINDSFDSVSLDSSDISDIPVSTDTDMNKLHALQRESNKNLNVIYRSEAEDAQSNRKKANNSLNKMQNKTRTKRTTKPSANYKQEISPNDTKKSVLNSKSDYGLNRYKIHEPSDSTSENINGGIKSKIGSYYPSVYSKMREYDHNYCSDGEWMKNFKHVPYLSPEKQNGYGNHNNRICDSTSPDQSYKTSNNTYSKDTIYKKILPSSSYQRNKVDIEYIDDITTDLNNNTMRKHTSCYSIGNGSNYIRDDRHKLYSEVQRGGIIPFYGFQKYDKEPRIFKSVANKFSSKNISNNINNNNHLTTTSTPKKHIVKSALSPSQNDLSMLESSISSTNNDITNKAFEKNDKICDSKSSKVESKNIVGQTNCETYHDFLSLKPFAKYADNRIDKNEHLLMLRPSYVAEVTRQKKLTKEKQNEILLSNSSLETNNKSPLTMIMKKDFRTALTNDSYDACSMLSNKLTLSPHMHLKSSRPLWSVHNCNLSEPYTKQLNSCSAGSSPAKRMSAHNAKNENTLRRSNTNEFPKSMPLNKHTSSSNINGNHSSNQQRLHPPSISCMERPKYRAYSGHRNNHQHAKKKQHMNLVYTDVEDNDYFYEELESIIGSTSSQQLVNGYGISRSTSQMDNTCNRGWDQCERRFKRNFDYHNYDLKPKLFNPQGINLWDTLDKNSVKSITAKAKALFDFKGQRSGEMSFNQGDILELKRCVDQNWYEAKLNNIIGLIPANFIRILVSIEEAALYNADKNDGVAICKYNYTPNHPEEISAKKGEVIYLKSKLNDEWYVGHSQNEFGKITASYLKILRQPKDTYKPSYTKDTTKTNNYETQNNKNDFLSFPTTEDKLLRYRVLYSYVPQHSDELTLQEGDIVYVSKKCEDGWYIGYNEKTHIYGTFPGNYVEIYPE